MARAMGCVDSRSRAAARDSSSAELVPKEGNGQMSVTAGRPTVRVPVLSKTTLSTLDAASKMSPPLISRPLDQKKWGGAQRECTHVAVPSNEASESVGTHGPIYQSAR